MIKLAVKNNIPRSTYYSRVHDLGWDKHKAATVKPRKRYTGEYAVYKNDEVIAMGTVQECAEKLGVTVNHIRWYTYNTGKKRQAKRRDQTNAMAVVKLDDVDEIEVIGNIYENTELLEQSP